MVEEHSQRRRGACPSSLLAVDVVQSLVAEYADCKKDLLGGTHEISQVAEEVDGEGGDDDQDEASEGDGVGSPTYGNVAQQVLSEWRPQVVVAVCGGTSLVLEVADGLFAIGCDVILEVEGHRQ